MYPQTFSYDRTPRPHSRAAIDAYVRHAGAANGFGDGGFAFASTAATSAARTVRRAVPARRPAPLGVVGRVFRALRKRVAALAAAWRRARDARATDEALQSLDDRALHDLGLDRSEISSLATRAGRRGDPTRVRMSHALNGLVV